MEAKVSFHVRRYLRECEERGARPSEATVTAHLRDSYAEYQRKPQGALRKVVAKVLKKAAESSPKSAGAETPKRARSDSDSDDEQQIRALEQQQQATSTSNSLNRAIQQNYAGQNSASAVERPIVKKIKIIRRKSKKQEDNDDDNRSAADETKGFVVERPTTRYSDVGGVQQILQEVRELIEYPLTHPEVYAHLGVEPPRGVLLHGPPGTGKSMLAHAIAGECGATFLKISAPEVVSGMSGESEQKLRELFDEAIARAPSIIFIDEIDAITPKRETSARGMEKRIVAQLLTSADSLSLENTGGKPVVLIGATNRPDALDSALRRAGRFDREICLGIPDEEAREKILRVLARKMTLEGDFDFAALARRTPGYVGADLVSLTKEAAVGAVNRIFTNMNAVKTITAEVEAASVAETSDAGTSDEAMEVVDTTQEKETDAEAPSAADDLRAQVEPFTEEQLAPLSITMADFEAAIPKVQPSSKREGFATIPDVTWDDIGALTEVRDELSLAVLQPIAHPERFAALGLSMPAGVLLYGPPGCGKTLLAKAIAHESGANFISIKGPELLDKYVGESERSVRQVFQRARASSPCVVFFDELDALAPRRSGGSGGDGGGNGVSERVVNQLLTEMDGLDGRRNVFVIAATNRPDIIDPAMLRPGRLDKLLYVPLPQASERLQILKTISAKCALTPSVQLDAIAADPRCEGFSGADLSALVREAGITALRETDFSKMEAGATTLGIEHRHFVSAFDRVFPSVSRADQRMFDRMKKNLRKSRSTMTKSSSSSTVAPGDNAQGEKENSTKDKADAKDDVDMTEGKQ
ncbi:Nuclear valosin-containing protein-like [Phytophthora fragariae]|uniref:Nuclear valosin-containing protein-like n=1 Tax=Phytophthora fragariae TaxID=53985 RepID=A0A6A3WTT9_9STRA|nr:Nuclear valosin-containing protein-like [Phytophthora fragariae]KAE8924505.1 Nuclear valosin-containing protein-like [Phytophthora fragariae]KAE8978508.1 Nuclear valosin-containing protein-like [Phytophthora fragariae]KAE9076294.1 Nuclear valosin-containing protein-like [Phytophthora fragariae]KAE9076748.1 Nuclear valosin-containing protein-like [Phytophthora fragariae]